MDTRSAPYDDGVGVTVGVTVGVSAGDEMTCATISNCPSLIASGSPEGAVKVGQEKVPFTSWYSVPSAVFRPRSLETINWHLSGGRSSASPTMARIMRQDA